MDEKNKIKNVGKFGVVPNLCARFDFFLKNEKYKGRSILDPLVLLILGLLRNAQAFVHASALEVWKKA
jgi:hypothetical protein